MKALILFLIVLLLFQFNKCIKETMTDNSEPDNDYSSEIDDYGYWENYLNQNNSQRDFIGDHEDMHEREDIKLASTFRV